MRTGLKRREKKIASIAFVMMLLFASSSMAAINGVEGNIFNLTAKSGTIVTAEGGAVYFWGYANGGGTVQYPGPTLIVNEGATITVNLANQLSAPVSIVFPGQTGITATGGTQGLITNEAPPNGSVSYSFVADKPGTYTYYSGTNPDLQIEMGLVGALIVRPAGYDPASPSTYKAYNDADSGYDREFLFMLSEMDPVVHELAALGFMAQVDTTTFRPQYWFINGRTGPDTMSEANAPWLPTQPYNCMPMMHPGEKVLLRIIGAGRDLHPYHTHGNHVRIIARDGNFLESSPGAGAGADISEMAFTVTSVPGGTVDAIFEWTGAKLGWDIYGHHQDVDLTPAGNFPGAEDIDHNGNGVFDNVPVETGEYAPDHGMPFPVVLPDINDLTVSGMYSGGPFLGSAGFLPPGQGGFNPNAGYFFMWHSHNEDEIVNYNIFPGGMMTMMLIEHPSMPIVE
jgi:FtsP/CotA-like multicopper oxidase with cupredoxin domain